MTSATAPPPNAPADVAALNADGFSVCKPDRGQKNPLDKRWPTLLKRPDHFAPDDLIGIMAGPISDGNRPGHALVVVDLDAEAARDQAVCYLPATAMEDGREGKPRTHRYYLVPFDSIPEWAWSRAPQASPFALEQKGHRGPFIKHFKDKATSDGSFDFLGTGAQAVCPGGGSPRYWEGGKRGKPTVVSFSDLWKASKKLADAIGAVCQNPPNEAAGFNVGDQFGQDAAGASSPPKESSPPPQTNGHHKGFKLRVESDLVSRALGYLRKCDPAISEKGGHAATLWAARVLVLGFDLGRDESFRILKTYYNPRCKPPWSDAELLHKIEQADTIPFDKPRRWLRDQSLLAAEHFTDLGNANRVTAAYGEDLRYCHPWKAWLVWDGRRWKADDTAEAVRRVTQAQSAFYQDAVKELAEAKGETAKNDALAIIKHALKWESAKGLRECLEVMRSLTGIPVLPADLDTDPLLFNVQNGTIDLRTGELRPHRHADYITKLCPVEYDPRATAPTWDRCLLRWMDGNKRLVAYLWRTIGYSLTGCVGEQCLWFLYGTGANGKSTFLATILALLGDYGLQAVSDLLIVKKHESHPTERAALFGKRFVATIETEEGKRLAEALLKQLTGGDKITARKMRQDFFEFNATHKIALAANHKPTIRGTDFAVWRRIKLIPFTVTITESEKDKDLSAKLLGELPGILVRAVESCLAWQRHGMEEPEEVRQATKSYQDEQDTLARFLADVCVLIPEARVKSSVLLAAYQDYSGDHWMTAVSFAKQLSERGYESKKGHGCMWWHGVGLQPQEDTNKQSTLSGKASGGGG